MGLSERKGVENIVDHSIRIPLAEQIRLVLDEDAPRPEVLSVAGAFLIASLVHLCEAAQFVFLNRPPPKRLEQRLQINERLDQIARPPVEWKPCATGFQTPALPRAAIALKASRRNMLAVLTNPASHGLADLDQWLSAADRGGARAATSA